MAYVALQNVRLGGPHNYTYGQTISAGTGTYPANLASLISDLAIVSVSAACAAACASIASHQCGAGGYGTPVHDYLVGVSVLKRTLRANPTTGVTETIYEVV